MHYAYIRVSSVDQHAERQKEALSASGIKIDKIYIEQARAKNINRPQLQDMLKQVRTGDTIVVHSLDRLCRIQRERYQVKAGLL
ncbi:recombinase family protein [Photorhabdus temperata]|uniref:recombinase family protein n=1 Tax=Photorhabdus temperata TaxID=574560 RepID=UPI000389FC1B|nr:recombinase family protein [Photorhabdus temperata]EQB98301.1 Resolvase-like protein, YdaA [Photorhabdus temperata subsp. temperata M1021]